MRERKEIDDEGEEFELDVRKSLASLVISWKLSRGFSRRNFLDTIFAHHDMFMVPLRQEEARK